MLVCWRVKPLAVWITSLTRIFIHRVVLLFLEWYILLVVLWEIITQLQWHSEIKLLLETANLMVLQQFSTFQSKQPIKELTEGGDLRKSTSQPPSVCLAIPVLTAMMGSETGTLNYKWDCAYANDFLLQLKTPTWANRGPLLKRQQAFWGAISSVGGPSGIQTQNGFV